MQLETRQLHQQLVPLADAALTAALSVAVRDVYGDDEIDAELAVIAMGKCGAGELNYISDVDVVFVAEPATPKIARVAAEMMRIGSACFFEVDANLRPEGASGALVRTLDSHVSYYKKWAETWEFQALLKARPLRLHRQRYDELRRQYLAHGIANMVTRRTEANVGIGGWTTL